MLHIGQDIHSLTDFKRRTSALVKQLHQTKRPIVLTVNGHAGVVVQDANAYQALVDDAEQWREQRRQAATLRQALPHGTHAGD